MSNKDVETVAMSDVANTIKENLQNNNSSISQEEYLKQIKEGAAKFDAEKAEKEASFPQAKIVSPPKPKEPEITKPKVNQVNISTTSTQPTKKVIYLQGHIKRYLDVCKGLHATTTDMSGKIKLFQNIIEYVIANPDREVLDEMYKFFVTNKNEILDPKYALSGLSRMSKTAYERVSTVYTMFRDITTGYPGKMNFDMARNLIGNQDDIFVYIQEKQQQQGR